MSEKEDWKWIQNSLGLTADGIPGAKTARAVRTFMSQEESSQPGTAVPGLSDNDAKIAKVIMDFEARYDKNGNIVAYKIPSGDGGGEWEVAGICDRYHPQETKKLVAMIQAGKHEEVKEEVSRYLIDYTKGVKGWFASEEEYDKHPELAVLLRDAAFNRGAGGAAKILQRALGVAVDGKVGPQTRSELLEKSTNPTKLIASLRAAREWYERSVVGRDESSKFWAGLSSRWNKITEIAKTWVL